MREPVLEKTDASPRGATALFRDRNAAGKRFRRAMRAEMRLRAGLSRRSGGMMRAGAREALRKPPKDRSIFLKIIDKFAHSHSSSVNT
jgi:hypothetical protein